MSAPQTLLPVNTMKTIIAVVEETVITCYLLWIQTLFKLYWFALTRRISEVLKNTLFHDWNQLKKDYEKSTVCHIMN